MEKQEGVTPEMLRQVKESIGSYNFAYSHNGASVFVFHKAKLGLKKYNSVVKVCVLKHGKVLNFSMSESVGNDAGTVFTCAIVGGMPLKQNRTEKIGLYPYGIFTAKVKGVPDTDIVEHAAEIFEQYDGENPNGVKIGKIFRSYVPMSYEKIKAQLAMMDGVKRIKQEQDNKIAQVMKFNQNFRDF